MSSLTELATYRSPWIHGEPGMSLWNSCNLIYQAACEKNLKRGMKYLLRFSNRELLQDSQGYFHDPLTFEVVEPPEEKPDRIWRTKTWLCRNFGGSIQQQFLIRRSLRDLLFGSVSMGFFLHVPACTPEEAANCGFVVEGTRMNESGFSQLNEKLRWPIAADDVLLDHDIAEHLLEFDLEASASEFDAICPIDGPIQTIPAEYYWSLPPNTLPDEFKPDSMYRLCPHCLMTLASKTIKMR